MNERYSRQTLFSPIGEGGQVKIQQKHVLLLGAGALGSANAEALTRAGVGKLTIVDRDYVGPVIYNDNSCILNRTLKKSCQKLKQQNAICMLSIMK